MSDSVADLAARYGTPLDELPGASALTPVKTRFPTVRVSDHIIQEEKDDRKREEYQRSKFYNLTSRHLVYFDAFSFRKLEPGNLTNVILPFYDRQRWVKPSTQLPLGIQVPMIPIGGGLPGFWSADNDIVWRVLRPILQIASHIIMNLHTLPWFDTFLLGTIQPVPQHRKHLGDQNNMGLFQILPRSEQQRAAQGLRDTRAERNKLFDSLANDYNYTWLLQDMHIHPLDGTPAAPVHGMSLYRQDAAGIQKLAISCLSFANLYPLVFQTLTDGERLGLQFRAANTIVHETMHAVGYVKVLSSPLLTSVGSYSEPYIGDEIMSELGFSHENALYGATVEEMVSAAQDPIPHAGFGHWLSGPWQGLPFISCRNRNSPILVDPLYDMEKTFCPIQISYYQDIQQNDYWNLGVRKYGINLFRPQKVPSGVAIDVDFNTGEIPGDWGWVITQIQSPTKPLGMATMKYNNDLAMTTLTLAGLTPAERLEQKWQDQVLRSLTAGSTFWSSWKLGQDVEEIMDVLMLQKHEVTKIPNVLLHLEQARKNFNLLTQQVIYLEITNVSTFSDRRKDLMSWHRGIRKFLRQLQNGSATEEDVQKVERECEAFEICRMTLFQPNDTPKGLLDDFSEFQTLQDAERFRQAGDIASAAVTCANLMGSDTASVFGIACTEILVASMEAEDIDSRIRMLLRGVNRFNALTSVSTPSDWTEAIDYWKKMASTTAQQLQKLSQAFEGDQSEQ